MACGLGTLVTMATEPEDQAKVDRVSRARPLVYDHGVSGNSKGKGKAESEDEGEDELPADEDAGEGDRVLSGPRTVACFGELDPSYS